MGTLYDLLGALPRADAEGLRVAFRRAVKRAHPDLHPGDPDAEMKFRQIVRANDILSDGDQRAAYDHLLVLADDEQKQMSRHAVARVVYKLATAVFAVAMISIVSIGSFALFLHLSSKSIAPSAKVEIAARAPAEPTTDTPPATRAPAPSTDTIAEPQPPAQEPMYPQQPVYAQQPAKAQEAAAASVKAASIASEPITPVIAQSAVPILSAAMVPTNVMLPDADTPTPASNPGSLGPPLDLTQNDAKAFREQGIVAYRNGDLNAALANFDQAIALDPKYAAAYIDRGIVLYRMQKFDRAFADLARAKRIEKTGNGKSTPASASTTGQSTTRKPRPVVELGPPPPVRRTAHFDAFREEVRKDILGKPSVVSCYLIDTTTGKCRQNLVLDAGGGGGGGGSAGSSE
jgi:tetratricopeptide (TPR) repeat protein